MLCNLIVVDHEMKFRPGRFDKVGEGISDKSEYGPLDLEA